MISITYIGRLFWGFTYLQPVTYFFFHSWLVLGPSPRCVFNFLLRWIPPLRSVRVCLHLLCLGTPPFLTPKEPSCTCADREVFPDLRSGHLISLLQQSSASATGFVLGASGWEQSFSFTSLDKHQLSSPWAHLSLNFSHLVAIGLLCFPLYVSTHQI